MDPELARALNELYGGGSDAERKNACQVLGPLMLLDIYERINFGLPDPHFFDGMVPGYSASVDRLLGSKIGLDAAANGLRKIGGAVSCALETKSPTEVGLTFLGAKQLSVTEKQRVVPILNRSVPRSINILDRVVAVKSVEVFTHHPARLSHFSHYYCRDNKWYPTASGNHQAFVAFLFPVLAQVLAERTWSVRLRLSLATPTVNLFTDPQGALDFFRFRDIPEGKSRRSALVHWVNEHWRKARGGDEAAEASIRVKEHLRGQRTFRWHGMEVEIKIPGGTDVTAVR